MSRYAPETAGALLTQAVPVVAYTATVAEARQELQDQIDGWQTLNYIYILDERSQLFGVVSIKELLRARPEQLVRDIATHNPITVRPETDRELVVHRALEYNIKAVPVTDRKGALLGVIDTDTILQTLYEESVEDLARLAGVSPETARSGTILHIDSAWAQIYGRAPYLLLGLAGGLLAAVMVGQYEAVLEEHVMVAAFIPLVVYLADAVGSQIQIIFIRALGLNTSFSLRAYITREVLVNLALGVLLSVVVALAVWIWVTDLALVILLLSAVFATTVLALVIAIALPLGLRALGKDPALGSGPLATVCIDLMSLLVYFYLATWLLL